MSHYKKLSKEQSDLLEDAITLALEMRVNNMLLQVMNTSKPENIKFTSRTEINEENLHNYLYREIQSQKKQYLDEIVPRAPEVMNKSLSECKELARAYSSFFSKWNLPSAITNFYVWGLEYFRDMEHMHLNKKKGIGKFAKNKSAETINKIVKDLSVNQEQKTIISEHCEKKMFRLLSYKPIIESAVKSGVIAGWCTLVYYAFISD